MSIPYPSNYFDPYGDEKHCPVCDACMVQSSDGEWECLQYHEDDLVSQKEYVENGGCPVCSSVRTEPIEWYDANCPETYRVTVVCNDCKAKWYEYYKFAEYEMVGTK